MHLWEANTADGGYHNQYACSCKILLDTMFTVVVDSPFEEEIQSPIVDMGYK